MRTDEGGEGGEAAPGTAAARAGHGRLLTGVALALLLLGWWFWGRGVPDGAPERLPATGDVAAVGRPLGPAAPRVHDPVLASATVRPTRIAIPALGVRAGIVARGRDAQGEVGPPPYTAADLVGWYAGGPAPGAPGAALLVGRLEEGTAAEADAGSDADSAAHTDTRRAVFSGLTGIEPGERVDVRRSDGSTAQFTVEDVRHYDRDPFDAREAYGTREEGRSELRLIAWDGTVDPVRRAHGARVVVSAYLTGFRDAPPVHG
ncbi:sortase domain-bontaining protein [Streptomyces sp. NPDC101150]|uniref:sortase domain-containing protein n=1 Tax=Streptomyces sp. NPDC101150 TaxID=3366114 RepID=UPI00380E2498